MTDYTALKTQLRAAMIDAGVQPPDIIKTDGAIQRFPTNDTLSDDAGWCIVFTQPIFGAHFGDWRTGAEHTWHAGRDTLTPAEHEALRAKFAETQQRQETAKRRRHAAARKEVEKIWAACKPAPSTHPYLVAKGVKSHGGVRVDAKGRLVIPLRDSDGVLHSLQYISAAPTGDDGGSYGKRFHPGGRKQGCFCMVGGGKREKICIAEGLATALSIHEATGYPVAAACDAGNLRPVAEALRAKHRGATLVLCADDDYLNAVNVGVAKASAAALTVGGLLAVPDFGDVKRNGESDFNDLAALRGGLTVRGCIESATPVVTAPAATWDYPAELSDAEWDGARTSPTCIVDDYLYADVGVLVAPGGTGKTTLMLYEAIHIVLELKLFGQLEVKKPGPVVILTAEDSREVLVGRLRELAKALCLREKQISTIKRDVRISDLCGSGLRLTCVQGDMVVPHPVVDVLIAELLRAPTRPVLVMIDPAISFGVGESRVNDAEQGLIEAARRIRRALGDVCVRYVHHTGKKQARERVLDQYATRGGSALPDGVRMSTVMQSVDAADWEKRTGEPLVQGENGIELARPKISFAPPNLPSILLKREGWAFVAVREIARSPEEQEERALKAALDMIREEIALGRFPTQNTIERAHKRLGLSQKNARAVVHRLLTEGWVESAKTDAARGAKAYLQPIKKAAATAAAETKSAKF